MRRFLLSAAVAAAGFAGGLPSSSHAICVGALACAVSPGCYGLANVCPTANTCGGLANVCPGAETCYGGVSVCDLRVASAR